MLKGGKVSVRRLLLRPTLLEFCRTHLIFTAAGALFTVLTGLVTTVFHLSETIMKAAPPDWSNASKTSLGTLPVLLPLLLCLAALVWVLTLQGRTRVLLGVLVLAFSAWLVQGMGRSITEPVAQASQSSSGWQAWSPAAQEQLLAQGRPVFVDYTAAWCVTCQYNKRTTLSDAKVLADFAAHGVALLRADWTRREPTITAALAALGRNGVPVYVLLAPGKAPIVMTELLTRQEVHDALATL